MGFLSGIPGSMDLVPGSRDLVPRSRDLVPGSRDLVPGSRDLVPGSRDLVFLTCPGRPGLYDLDVRVNQTGALGFSGFAHAADPF